VLSRQNRYFVRALHFCLAFVRPRFRQKPTFIVLEKLLCALEMPQRKGSRKQPAANKEENEQKAEDSSPKPQSPGSEAPGTVPFRAIKDSVPGISNKEISLIHAYCVKNEISNVNKWHQFLGNLENMSPEGQMLFLDKMSILDTTKAIFMAKLKTKKDADVREPAQKKTRLNGTHASDIQGEDKSDSDDIVFGSDYPDHPDGTSSTTLSSDSAPAEEKNPDDERYYFHGSTLRTASTEDEYHFTPDSFEVNYPLLNYKFCRDLEPRAREIKRHVTMLFGKQRKIPKSSFVKREIVGDIRVLYDTQEKLKMLIAEDILDYTRKSSILSYNPISKDEWKQLKERYHLLKKAKDAGGKRCYRCSGHGHLAHQCLQKNARTKQWDREHKQQYYQQQYQQPYQQQYQHQQQQPFFRAQRPGNAGRSRDGVQTYDRSSDK
jgi:hypothetical protein